MITAPATLEHQLADLTFRHGNLVRELHESRGKAKLVRYQLATCPTEEAHKGQQVLCRLGQEHAGLASMLARVNCRIQSLLSLDS